MTNQNKHQRAILIFCIDIFSHGTQKKSDGPQSALEPGSKE
jgi:hypothetical protein